MGFKPRQECSRECFYYGREIGCIKGLQKVATNQPVPAVITGVSVSIASPLEKLVSAAVGKVLSCAEGAGPIGVVQQLSLT